MSGQNYNTSPKQNTEEATLSTRNTYQDVAAAKTIKNTLAYNQALTTLKETLTLEHDQTPKTYGLEALMMAD